MWYWLPQQLGTKQRLRSDKTTSSLPLFKAYWAVHIFKYASQARLLWIFEGKDLNITTYRKLHPNYKFLEISTEN
ncbi:hypothetical protein BHE74_00036708 [Ensete ventricosum]|nr:hypothetical protein BHE74_00036708 [Ensete ventricosum]